ncbi:hypothetical protein EVAR_11319_1 [Eumeta japonica]|uniref:Secreted protein n=1 Tax=Eumeta variegata TaxID=151549 RepID=A0A4C1U0X3_EUMVA|nr:hypothetical protein EVAR_11319_1 [Eumeta japonica]
MWWLATTWLLSHAVVSLAATLKQAGANGGSLSFRQMSYYFLKGQRRNSDYSGIVTVYGGHLISVGSHARLPFKMLLYKRF